ncbi:MAG: PAS domain S-box protein [Acidobacteria bacterium]|nr:MAG: PAS domain S-box protein [Acidobacteriota bacterium]
MQATRQAADGDSGTDVILESISDGVFTVDEEWRVKSFNRAAEEITGIAREEALGKPCWEVFRASVCEGQCALRQTMETGKPVVNRSCYIIDAKGQRIPISVSTGLLRAKDGSVTGGVETFRDLTLVEELRKELEGRFQIGNLVTRSPAMRPILEVLPALAGSSSTVLLQGETGTGKEVLAHTIHSLSPRKNKPFVAVSCGALPDTLLESELFGYKAGAFTGADRDKPGRFAVAEGGTLFLDEIGEISTALQVRLLRVLQERVYEPLGTVRPVPTDVRVIAATNRDLEAEVGKGSFRQDLFYRINVLRLQLPPLRQRREDIPFLVEHFIIRFNRLQGKSLSGTSPEVMALLTGHDYPGNIRELENIIERAFVLCPDGQIEFRHLPPEMVSRLPVAGGNRMETATRATQAQAIREALGRNRYRRLAAARELGIHKSTLFRKMKDLGIDLPRRQTKDNQSSLPWGTDGGPKDRKAT